MNDAHSPAPPWRVAVTHDDVDGEIRASLEKAGFIPVTCPVLLEGRAPDQPRLDDAARNLERYDWVICASVRAVRALTKARGSQWPSNRRTAAVGAITAQAMMAAGARQPVSAGAFTAAALWDKLQRLDSWHCRDVLVVTVAGGRRDLIDGLTAAGASVTELVAYTMVPRSADDICKDWEAANPDAVLLGSAATAQQLIDAIGVTAMRAVRVVVPIGPTTAATLVERGIAADPPEQATFAAAIDRLVSLRDGAGLADDRAAVDPSGAG